MSYLLDALRKAEHERKLGRVPDLTTETRFGDSRAGDWPRWLPLAAVALLVGNAALLGSYVGYYGLQWLQTTPAPAASSPAESASAASFAARKPAVAEPGVSEPAVSEPSHPAPTADLATKKPAPQAEAAPLDAPAPTPETSRPKPELPEEDAQVDPLPAEVPLLEALSSQARQGIPELRVNGHLYSSVAGRSFVLVNGRRYREGERLADGGAVESIDDRGVVVNHEGQRFRLAAPR